MSEAPKLGGPMTTDPPIQMLYTNHRGETAIRTIWPVGVYYGATLWHPEPTWLLQAWDMDKGELRDFDLTKAVFVNVTA